MPESTEPLPSDSLRYPEETRDWQVLEAEVLAMVRRDLGNGLRRRLESMDVVQDVMSELLCERRNFDARKIRSFRAWIRRVVQNRIRNLAAFHSSPRRDVGKEITAAAGIEAPSSEPSPVDRAEADADYHRLLRALGDLNEIDRLVIVLRSHENLPWEQIAFEIGKATPDAARVAFGRAMVQLTGHFHRRTGEE